MARETGRTGETGGREGGASGGATPPGLKVQGLTELTAASGALRSAGEVSARVSETGHVGAVAPVPADVIVAAVLRELAGVVPGFKLVRKRESWVCKWVLAPLLFCVGRRTFLDGEAAITIGRTVYASQALIDNPAGLAEVLVHEGVHMVRANGGAARAGLRAWWSRVWWTFDYLSPQAFGIVPLVGAVVDALAEWGNAWWAGAFALAGLAALAPWPARFRADEEARAYGIQAGFAAWAAGGCGDLSGRRERSSLGPRGEFVADLIAGWPYYRATWTASGRAAIAEQVMGFAWAAEGDLRAGGRGYDMDASAEWPYVEGMGAAVRGARGEWGAARLRLAMEAGAGAAWRGAAE